MLIYSSLLARRIYASEYLNCGILYEDMTDHRSYTQLIGSCEIITAMINLSYFHEDDLC